MRLRVAQLFASAIAIALSVAVYPQERGPAARLPLGDRALPEVRDVHEIQPGLTYTHITRGIPSPDDHWTIRALLPDGDAGSAVGSDAPSGMLGTRQNADAMVGRLQALGWTPQMQVFMTSNVPTDVAAHELGYAVSVGHAESDAALAADEERLRAHGFRVRRWHTSYDGDDTTGPWQVHVLTVDPRVWAITSSLGESVAGRETVSRIASRAGAVAAVNGGFFVIQPYDPDTGIGDGIPGEPAGISIVDGTLVSEATNGRPLSY